MQPLLEVVSKTLNSENDINAEQALECLCNTCSSFTTAITPYVSQLVSLSESVIDDEEKSPNLREKAM